MGNENLLRGCLANILIGGPMEICEICLNSRSKHSGMTDSYKVWK